MDYIHIDSLRVGGVHGHYEKEWSREQDFDISLRVGFETSARHTDALADTIDYDDLKKIIEETFKGKRRFLIERIAEEIADTVLLDHRIQEVTLTIRKLEAWENGVPGITITRSQSL